MVRARATSAVTAFILLLGLVSTRTPAEAQSAMSCSGAAGSSQVSSAGPFEIGETGIVELESDVDGSAIQIGFVRPDAPAGYRSPVIVHASSYFATDLRDVEVTDCNPFLVQNFVQHGYTVAFVPTRGAGGTDSCADLMGPKERADLDQAVTWLGTQSWSNGNVGMTGVSYDGSTPWEVASSGNPHLKTIVPVSGVHNLFDLIYERGRNDWRWWFFVTGYYHYYGLVMTNPAGGRDADRWAGSAAFCDTTDEGLQATVQSYITGDYDELGYWSERNMNPLILKKYRGSVMLVQGMQDWNVDPAHQYPFINQLEKKGVYVKHLLGQWDHAFPDSPHVGPRGDYADILLGWWDRWLKEDKTADTGPRVEVQDSALEWRRETAWPPSDARTTNLYLSADATLSPSPQKGEATALLGPGTRNRYFFVSGNETVYNDTPLDHNCVDCATFAMDVKDDLRLVGLPELELRVTPTGPSGFVSAYLVRVDSAGAWQLLGWGANDLRFPDGSGRPTEVTAGEEITLTFPLQPLDAVVHEGEQLLLILDQGHADHMPTVPFFPVELRYGQALGSFRFQTTIPAASDFFTPPGLPG